MKLIALLRCSLLIALGGVACAQAPAAMPQSEDQSADSAAVWGDSAAVARGSAMLEALVQAAGGKQAWQAAGGVRIQQLDRRWALTNLATQEWKVHSIVPRLFALTADGNGWAYSEFMREVPVTREMVPDYRREILNGDAAWAEAHGEWMRRADISRRSENRVLREYFLACMPFSLETLGARMAYLRTDEVVSAGEGEADKLESASQPRAANSDPSQASIAKPQRLELYMLHLARPVVMEESEAQREFIALVDPDAEGGPRIHQLIYFLYAIDRDNFELPSSQAYVEFEGSLPAGGLRLANKRWHWHVDGRNQTEYWMEAPVLGPPAPESLRKPWISNLVYEVPLRADFWDPPPAESTAAPMGPLPAGQQPASKGAAD